MKRRLLAAAACVIVPSLYFGTASALAAPAQTDTVTRHDFVETFQDVAPNCTSTDVYNITATTNQVVRDLVVDTDVASQLIKGQ